MLLTFATIVVVVIVVAVSKFYFEVIVVVSHACFCKEKIVEIPIDCSKVQSYRTANDFEQHTISYK